jgi:hypothetical protein
LSFLQLTTTEGATLFFPTEATQHVGRQSAQHSNTLLCDTLLAVAIPNVGTIAHFVKTRQNILRAFCNDVMQDVRADSMGFAFPLPFSIQGCAAADVG